MDNKRYKNLDGIRAYACIGIVLMHVMANGKFSMNGFVFDTFIFSFTNFTFLFMLLSAFSMCCGYYKGFQENKVNLEAFYKKRYQRIWPYFALMCTLELIVNHDLKSLYEWFADLTLVFGLIPKNGIEVVGVGWFLGTIFVFYMIFPYFVFLIKNKQRAWFTLVIAILLHVLCKIHFMETGGRVNIIYSAMFFVAGGLIYLYKEKLEKIKIPALVLTVISLLIYYLVNNSEITTLVVFTMMVIAGINFDNTATKIIFQNNIVQFLGAISMEIYLCHMFVYRAMEKVGLIHIFSSSLANYLTASIATLFGAIVIAYISKRVLDLTLKIKSDAAKG